jgi:hypothetical protein
MEYDSFAGSALVGRDANVDYWGYYNAINNASLLPPAGADLEPREYATKIGALTKLTYPTKGYSTIEYEQNSYSYLQSQIHSATSTTVITRSYRRFWNHEFSHPDSSGMFNLVLPQSTRVDVILNNNSTNTSLPPCSNQGILQTRTLAAGTYTMNQVMEIYNFLPCDRQDIASTPGLDITLVFKTSNLHKYGGIRVKKMTDFVSSSGQSYASSFSYTMPDDDQLSSGVISAVPNYEVSFSNSVANFNIYRSAPFNPEALSQLYYKAVAVTRNDNITTYQYTSHSNQVDNLGKWAFWFDKGTSGATGTPSEAYVATTFVGMGSYSDYYFLRGLPSQTDIKDLNGNPKQSTTYAYSGYGENTCSIPSLHYELFTSYELSPGDLDAKTRLVYYGKAYYQIGGWPRKVNETVTTYGSNNANPVTINTTYEYGTSHLQVKKQIVSQNDGSIRETSYTYPQDYATVVGNTTLQSMIAANMVSYPIEQVTRLVRASGTRVIDASLTTYGSFTVEANKPPLYLPNKEFRFNGFNNSIPSFTAFSGASNDVASTSYYESTKYVAYDKRGNLLSLLQNGSDKVSYLWGYKGQHPVAEIQNADNAQVLSALAGTSFEALADETNTATILSKINGLRTGLSSSLVTGYLYQPLIGLTQKIAPNGLSTYYTYDTLERLEKIKDNNNQTVKSYKYNYSTP